jgi:hypothetical protein
MARPTKHPDEQRSQTARARVTAAEHEHIKQQASLAGLGVSEFVRRRLLGYEVPSAATRSADPGLVTEINRLGLELRAIGNNANQLALAAHTNRRAATSWESVVDRIHALAGQVTAVLEKVVLSDT